MFVCPWIAKEDIWNIADEFRSKYWSENSLPVDIESINPISNLQDRSQSKSG